jgi:hypothetical protein
VEDADRIRADLISRVRKTVNWCYEQIEWHGQRIGSEPKKGERRPEYTTIAFARILSSIGLADHASQLPLGAYKTHQDVIGLLHRYVPILKQYADKLTPKIDPVNLTSFPIQGAVFLAPPQPSNPQPESDQSPLAGPIQGDDEYLSPPEIEILTALSKSKKPLTKQALAEAVGLDGPHGAFGRNLRHLKTLELIDNRGYGYFLTERGRLAAAKHAE